MDSAKMHIDDKDREILNELQNNCKQPVRKIAKKLGLRVTTAYDRIRRMEKLGIIKGYKAQIDAKKVGVPGCAFVLVRVSTEGKKNTDFEIVEKVAKFNCVSECHLITGEHEMILKIRADDVNKIGHFLINEIKPIDGIERTITMVVLETAKEEGPVPL